MKTYNYIYLITNKINGKIYIGKHSTNNLNDNYFGSGVLINKSILKYGLENFTKEYLAFCDTKEKLNYLERFYIKKYKARERGYNLTEGGDGGRTSGTWTKGYKDSDETRKKKSESHKGLTHTTSEEAKEKNRQSHLGKSCSEETKQKISIANKGRIKTKEEIEKISNAHKGKPKSEEHKRKISEALKLKYKN